MRIYLSEVHVSCDVQGLLTSAGTGLWIFVGSKALVDDLER